MKAIFFLLPVFFMFIIGSVKAQISDAYFSDLEQKDGGSSVKCYLKYQNKIIIGGSSFDKSKNYPSIRCLDTLGNILWDTSVLDTSHYQSGGIIKLLDTGDGYVYAVQSGTEVWKVDALNGSVIWKRPIPNTNFNAGNDIRHLQDYNASTFMVGLCQSNSSSGAPYKSRILFVSKATGDTIYSKNFTRITYEGYGLAVDKQKNIYCSSIDSVYKFSAAYPHAQVWAGKYPTAQVATYHQFYCDTVSNVLHCFANGGSSGWRIPRIVKVNCNTGALIST